MLKLFLPVLFPSWRFFSSIGPSPRIHIAFLNDENSEASEWIEFRPRPERVGIKSGVWRLLHNPEWNETLYMNTCAERLFEGYSAMRDQEIMQRILRAARCGEINTPVGKNFVTYRVSALIREGETLSQTIVFVAKPTLIKESSQLIKESSQIGGRT